MAAAVRRLDALAGRPLPEDQYLVLFGRVWLRRDLMWMGFLLWVLLVFRGTARPLARRLSRGAGPPDARLPAGVLFRVLLLAAIFLAPVFSVLLLPAAALALLLPRPWWARALAIAGGILPLLSLLLALAAAAVLAIVRLEDGSRRVVRRPRS